MPEAKKVKEKKNSEPTPEHYTWLTEARDKNMRTSLNLYSLLIEHEGMSGQDRTVARLLVSVAFSLWRAAFLARTSVSDDERELHARSFLQKMIEDNMINFIEDKKYNSYSFRYYLYTATMYMNHINSEAEGIAGNNVDPSSRGRYTDRWDMAQKRFEKAVCGFKEKLEAARRKQRPRAASR